MSKVILVCLRTADPAVLESTRQKLERFLETLRPDNLDPAPAMVCSDGSGLLLGMFNPTDAAVVQGCNAYAGWLANPSADWWTVGSPAPEGTYALFRSNLDRIEVLADYAASRTVWVAQTDDIFVAATSQRAIPWFLGGFELNPQALGWMLSSGSLCPGVSWDRRARQLMPAGVAELDRATWRLTMREPRIEFQVSGASYEENKNKMRAALQESLSDLHVDYSKWVLPLSGGHDSRALLLGLKHHPGLRCITWGLREALQRPGSDAVVAHEVAQYLRMPHEYFETDLREQSAEKVLQRFVIAGEGRLDHITGYLDGFRIWSHLASSGVRGVIRGDHPFGHYGIETTEQARYRAGLMLWSDYRGVPSLEQLDLPHLADQRVPDSLTRRPSEPVLDWRDRLYQEFRVTTVHAALNDLKAPYVEIANPFLLRRFVELARELPPHLRTGKKLAVDVVAEWDIPIPYADSTAIGTSDNPIAAPAMREIILDELNSRPVSGLLSAKFAAYVADALPSPGDTQRSITLKGRVKQLLPQRLRAAIKSMPDFQRLSPARLALRGYIIGRMANRLQKDARGLQ